ncbi:hypothetical protein CC80DRAFT_549874 [Byssothecium circinans]|uniref:VWFA domain-containing protein n=1 Tax=Byssothecium circinans TaxID=147558 RepID=A0A6A5TRU8_9PLEO|nr:hypothetical protein CC80DRAFT_549874 [Byssothecium circinans]
MSVSLLFDHRTPPHQRLPHFYNPSYGHSSSNMSSNDSSSGAFGKIKSALSLKKRKPQQQDSNASSKQSPRQSAFLAPQSNNPFTTGSTPTRRPSGRSSKNVAPSDPPPAYTPTSQSSSTQPAMTATIPTGSADDPYSFLGSFDTIFLIDDSGSMAGRSWREVSEALRLITPICVQHDADGIDIYFLNTPDSNLYKNVTTASTVVEIFQTVRPWGGTLTGSKLNQILKPYLRRYEAQPETTKPVNIIVITDGKPIDDVESPIIAAAKKLDKLDAPPWQVGIQFFQVGKEEEARIHLKTLDNELKKISGDEDLRDIVDTVEYQGDNGEPLTAAGILKVTLGSVVKRLDRNSTELHRK